MRKLKTSYVVVLAIILTLFCAVGFFILFKKQQYQNQTQAPLLAQYYLDWDISDQKITELARYNLLILSPSAAERNPDLLFKLKKINPQIKILASVSASTINPEYAKIKDIKFLRLLAERAEKADWYLKNAAGEKITINNNEQVLNVTEYCSRDKDAQWNDYLPHMVTDYFLQKRSWWDGVMYDNAWDSFSWQNQQLDLNKKTDLAQPQVLDYYWQHGIMQILLTTQKLAPNKIVLVNTNIYGVQYNQQVNGKLMINAFADNYSWKGLMSRYLPDQYGQQPNIVILNHGDKVQSTFELTSVLLGNGYYIPDTNYWPADYERKLGAPLGQAQDMLNSENNQPLPCQVNCSESVWARQYEKALVLVNSTNQAENIYLKDIYLDANGEKTLWAQLPARSGKILLKP